MGLIKNVNSGDQASWRHNGNDLLSFNPSLHDRKCVKAIKLCDALPVNVFNQCGPHARLVNWSGHDLKVDSVQIRRDGEYVTPMVDLVFHIIAARRN